MVTLEGYSPGPGRLVSQNPAVFVGAEEVAIPSITGDEIEEVTIG